MVGVIIILVVLVVAIPVAVLLSGSIAAGVLGFMLQRDVAATHENSELLDLNT